MKEPFRRAATAIFAPMAVIATQAFPRPTFVAVRRLRVEHRATKRLLSEATLALREGKPRPGRRLAHALLSHAPLSAQQRGSLHRELGHRQFRERELGEAIANLTEAITQRPSDVAAAGLLVRSSASLGDAAAVQASLAQVSISDLAPDALQEALTVLAAEGAWRTILAAATQENLTEPSLLHIAGLAEQRAEPSIRSEIDQVVRDELDSSRIWFERGRQHESDGHLEEALAAYGEALRRPGTSAGAWYHAGRLHLRTGDAAAAHRHLVEAVNHQAERPRWRYTLGRALLAQERYAEATDQFAHALRLEPGNARYAIALARARRRSNASHRDGQETEPTPPDTDGLRDNEVGVVGLDLSQQTMIGWILDVPGNAPRVDVEVDGTPVARARATTPVTLADGRRYLQFRRAIGDLWSYLGHGDVIQVTAGGKPLSLLGWGDRAVMELDRPSCVTGLLHQLENGYVFNKFGRIRRSLQDDLRWQDHIVGLFHELRSDVRDAISAELFPFYGTLLGAVREHDFIGHDNDFDAAYISAGTTPGEVHNEFRRLCLHLIDRGQRIEARGWHIWVEVGGRHGRLDISFCWFDEQDQFQAGYGYHGTAVPRSEAFRVDRRVRLGQNELLAPSNAEDLLAQLYGPGWREPDPGFTHKSGSRIQDQRYRIPSELRNLINQHRTRP